MFRLVGKTDPGSVRDHNEDAFFANEASGLAVVVDGMGGYAAGEVASDIIVQSLKEQEPEAGGLVAALMECHNRILAYSEKHPESKGMAAAVVLAKLEPSQLSVCWAGDSRAYLFNPGTGLTPVSRDHSYVQWLLSRGEITESEARDHPKRNLVTQGLGLNSPQPELTTVPWGPGDLLLLCSDGLTDELDDDRIASILKETGSAGERCEMASEALVRAALASGGRDNITVLLAENLCPEENTAETPGASAHETGTTAGWLPILLGAGAAVLMLIIGTVWLL